MWKGRARVSWPAASMRQRLGFEALPGIVIDRSVVIGATLPPRAGFGLDKAGVDRPTVCLLDTAFDVDKEGFLVVKDLA